MNIEIKENQFAIFVGLFISTTLPVCCSSWLLKCHVSEFFKQLLTNMDFITIIVSLLILSAVFPICLMPVTAATLLFRLFSPAKIVLSEEGLIGKTTKGLIHWDDIENIDYFYLYNLKFTASLFPKFAFVICSNFFRNSVKIFIRNGLRLDGIIKLTLKNNQIILLDIDESFTGGPNSVLKYLKACREANIKGSSYLERKLQELGFQS